MAEMDITICNREGGCKSQFGEFGPEADIQVQAYADYQVGYMQNDCEVRPTCSQICSVLDVKLDSVDVPGRVVSGIRVSGKARNGTVFKEAPGVAFVDEDGIFKTKLV